MFCAFSLSKLKFLFWDSCKFTCSHRKQYRDPTYHLLLPPVVTSSMFTEALFTRANLGAHQWVDGWRNCSTVYIHGGIWSNCKNEILSSAALQMGLRVIMSIACIPFILFSCIIVLPRTSITDSNRTENRHPHLVPNLREKPFSLSLLVMTLAIGNIWLDVTNIYDVTSYINVQNIEKFGQILAWNYLDLEMGEGWFKLWSQFP